MPTIQLRRNVSGIDETVPATGYDASGFGDVGQHARATWSGHAARSPRTGTVQKSAVSCAPGSEYSLYLWEEWERIAPVPKQPKTKFIAVMRNFILVFLFIWISLLATHGQQPTRWRGPDSNGIYPGTGLLKVWPKEGLELLWSFDEMGFYDERGVLALVKPDPEKFNIVSRMKITLGTGSQWANPVAHNGILYILRGTTLMAYNLKK